MGLSTKAGVAAIILFLSTFAFAATYGGGNGTPENPYQIWTPVQMNTIGTNPADWSKSFILMADVNMAAYTGTQYNIIGNSTTKFTGKFDGNNHIIRNLKYSSTTTDYVGLFGYTYGAEIKNLGIEDVNITGRNYVSGLIGNKSSFYSNVTNCYSTGFVSGTNYVGGLVGDDDGNISNCYTNCTVGGNSQVGGLMGNSWGKVVNCYSIGVVNGTNYVGGLVGYYSGDSMYNCYSTGNVSGNSYIGGLAGHNNDGTLDKCYSTSTVTGIGVDAGGLIGENIGKVTKCYSAGTVTGNTNVGGLIGDNYKGKATNCYSTGSVIGKEDVGGLIGKNSEGTVNSCYSTGTVGGTGDVGGLIGYNSGTVSSCYSTGSIGGTDYIGGLIGLNRGTVNSCYSIGTASGTNYVGGLIGQNDNSSSSCFWDIQTSNQARSAGGKGLTTVQMKTISIYQNAGWAGRGWVMQDGIDYPHLAWEGTAGTPIPAAVIPFTGSGIPENPYRIWTAQEFALLSWYPSILDKHIILMEDLNLDGILLYPIGDMGRFTGSFNGNNHIISNAVVNQSANNYVGLFSYLGIGGEIRNLGVENLGITGNRYVGGLVGYNDGTVANCYLTGSVDGNSCVGGMIGGNFDNAKVNSCYSAVSVIGNDVGGGLMGLNRGLLSSCYSVGTVSGNYYIGGLIGSDLGNAIGCFWDIQTSGQERSAAGKGLTTVQMKTKSIYQNADWTGNGWVIRDGIDYPHLDWEGTAGDQIPPAVIPFAGSGTEADPYQIWSTEDFNLLRWYVSLLDKHIILMADLNLDGIEIYAIGELGPFAGNFNGNGYVIKNAIINQPANRNVGIFSCLGIGGQIENLGIEDVNVEGSDDVGSLIGTNYGRVNNCYSTGTAKGNNPYNSLVGGLIGTNMGSVSGSYSIGTVTGTGSCIGGLIGFNYENAIVSSCFSNSIVTGQYSNAGGIIGSNHGSISSCYATGAVSSTGNYSSVGGLAGYNGRTISSCFWDTQTSEKTNGVGRGSSTGVYGRTTVEMKQQATFTASPYNWDFLGETVNGPNDFWRMCVDGISYPKLKWEYGQADYICPDGVDFTDYAMFAAQWLQTDFGDANGLELTDDGLINFDEFAIMANLWKVTGCGSCNGADYSKDGDIDEDDLVILGQNWLQTDYGTAQGIDLTADGKVDYNELYILAENWLE